MLPESTKNTQLGDLIQIITERVVADDGYGNEVVHGVKGAIAHVISLDVDGSVGAYFERTRTISLVFAFEFKRLCSGNADELGARGSR